jgi:hypothetical protein
MSGDKAIHGGVEDTAADTENFMRNRIAELEEVSANRKRIAEDFKSELERLRTLAQAVVDHAEFDGDISEVDTADLKALAKELGD